MADKVNVRLTESQIGLVRMGLQLLATRLPRELPQDRTPILSPADEAVAMVEVVQADEALAVALHSVDRRHDSSSDVETVADSLGGRLRATEGWKSLDLSALEENLYDESALPGWGHPVLAGTGVSCPIGVARTDG
jgi:hypothetical protein